MNYLERVPVEKAILVFVVATGAALRIWAIAAKPLWLDESFSLWVAQHEIAALIDFVGKVDHHPPLYYLALHYWQDWLGTGQGSLRLLSAILGIAAIPIFYFGGRTLVGRSASAVAALLLALSPFHVRYSQEVRMYALMVFLGAALLWGLGAYLTEWSSSGWRRHTAAACVVATEAALMWTHNTAALLAPLAVNLGVLGPYLWGRMRKSALPAYNEDGFLSRWLAIQAAVLLLWLPWLPRFAAQAGTVYREFWIEPLTGYFVWLTFHNFNLAFPDGWFPGSPWWDLLYWALALAGVYALRKNGPVAFLLAALTLTPALGELMVSLKRPILYDRTLIWTTLPYYLLIGSGLTWIGRSPWIKPRSWLGSGAIRGPGLSVMAGLLATLVLLSSISLRSYYRDYEKEDWPSAAAFVAASAEADDLLLFSAPWSQIPFDYYAGQFGVDWERRGVPADLFGREDLEPRMAETDLDYLRDLVASHDDVWLVYTHEWYTDPQGLIVQELNRAFDLVDERTFAGPRVLRFRRSQIAGN